MLMNNAAGLDGSYVQWRTVGGSKEWQAVKGNDGLVFVLFDHACSLRKSIHLIGDGQRSCHRHLLHIVMQSILALKKNIVWFESSLVQWGITRTCRNETIYHSIEASFFRPCRCILMAARRFRYLGLLLYYSVVP